MTHYKKHKLTRRMDGRWQLKFSYNKRYFYVYGLTQKECCEKYDRKLNEVKNSKNIRVKAIRFFDWVDYYLRNYADKLKSFHTIMNVTKNYIYKYFENKDMNKLTALDIDMAFNNIKNSRTKLYVYQLIHKILLLAYKKQITKQNLADFIEPVRYKSQKGKALSIAEIKAIINNCTDTDVANLFKFYFLTGARKSEALNIQVGDIDFKNNIIHIRGTKREKSDRYIPIFSKLRDLLISMNVQSAIYEDKIFNISERRIKHQITIIQERCKIDFSIKDFRTTFASRCFEIGINEKVLQEWMGHAQSSTTKEYYVFVQDDFREKNKTMFDNDFDT